MTAPPPTKPVPPSRTPAKPPSPAPTTAPDGSVITTSCAVAPPTPMAGPQISPEHTVGGPLLARSGVVVDGPATLPPPPVVTDVSYVISDLDTGQVLAAKNPHALLLPASTLKTLTSLVVLPALSPTTVVTASHAAVTAEGTRVGMVEGNPYTVDQLMTGMVLISGNDTAYALAEAYGGRDKLIAAMNRRAAELGAWDTAAVDPSGLDEPGQRSSAYDLALVGRAVMQLPEFRRYATTKTFTFPGGTDQQGKVFPPFQIDNHNTLLEKYPGTIGVKNGYTSGARHTFIGAVTRGGRTLLVSQMGGVALPSWQPSAALLDWAFANFASLRPIGQLVAPGAPQPPEWQGGSAVPSEVPAAPAAAGAPAVSPSSTPPPLALPAPQQDGVGLLTSARRAATNP
ncbi:MAG: D-alanyl-D-alanine carboxypeptidase, partial [Actinomycetota bacterium]|nr:D-alanyl-D-alanine carboxypeptidase [Actinomycetota bacterium]